MASVLPPCFHNSVVPLCFKDLWNTDKTLRTLDSVIQNGFPLYRIDAKIVNLVPHKYILSACPLSFLERDWDRVFLCSPGWLELTMWSRLAWIYQQIFHINLQIFEPQFWATYQTVADECWKKENEHWWMGKDIQNLEWPSLFTGLFWIRKKMVWP